MKKTSKKIEEVIKFLETEDCEPSMWENIQVVNRDLREILTEVSFMESTIGTAKAVIKSLNAFMNPNQRKDGKN